MTEHPAWDYWLYEDLPNGRYRDVARSGAYLSENDIRSDEYDLDLDEWCNKKHFFWTPQEAALISFFRDPDKVERTEDDFILHDDVFRPIDNDDHDGLKNIELREHITDLYELILHAQKTGELPGLIYRAAYIEWCALIGFDFPRPILQDLQAFEAKHSTPELDNWHRTDSGQHTDDDLPADGAHLPHKKSRAPQTRLEANQTKIIFSLLAKGRLLKQDTGLLGRELSEILKKTANEEGNDDLPVGPQTIQDRLDEARAVVKKASN